MTNTTNSKSPSSVLPDQRSMFEITRPRQNGSFEIERSQIASGSMLLQIPGDEKWLI
jgi:hypothetical protein